MTQVAIAGVGVARTDGEPFSHAELLFRATRAAFDDAGIERQDLTSAVTTSYDYVEGRPLSNQFTLDSIGGVMKSCDLRLGDTGLHGFVGGVVEALAEPGGIVVAASVLLDRTDRAEDTNRTIEELGYEPNYLRPIIAGAAHPEALLFGLAARAYLAEHGLADEELADLVAAESLRGNGAARARDEILASPVVAGPLRELHLAPKTDVAVAVILSTEPPRPRRATVRGVGWSAVSAQPGNRDLAQDEATAQAARRAFELAGTTARDADRVEVSNSYGIDELLAVEALGLAERGQGAASLRESSHVNPTGGEQAAGWARGTSSLVRLAEAVEQLSGDGDGGLLVCQSWGGFAGSSAAVAVIETGNGGR